MFVSLALPLRAEPSEENRRMRERHRQEFERGYPSTYGYDGYLVIQLTESGPPRVVLSCCPDGEAAPDATAYIPREILDSETFPSVLAVARGIGPKVRVNVKGKLEAEGSTSMRPFEIKPIEGPWNDAAVAVVNASSMGTDVIDFYLQIPAYVDRSKLVVKDGGVYAGNRVEVWVDSSAPFRRDCVGKATNDWLKWNVRERFGSTPVNIRIRNSVHRYENDRSYDMHWDGTRLR